MSSSGFTECDTKHCHKTAEHEVRYTDGEVKVLCAECAKKTYFNDDDAHMIVDLDPGVDFEVIL